MFTPYDENEKVTNIMKLISKNMPPGILILYEVYCSHVVHVA